MCFGLGAIVGSFAGGKLTDNIGHRKWWSDHFCRRHLFIFLGYLKITIWSVCFLFLLSAINEAFRPQIWFAIGSYSDETNHTVFIIGPPLSQSGMGSRCQHRRMDCCPQLSMVVLGRWHNESGRSGFIWFFTKGSEEGKRQKIWWNRVGEFSLERLWLPDICCYWSFLYAICFFFFFFQLFSTFPVFLKQFMY